MEDFKIYANKILIAMAIVACGFLGYKYGSGFSLSGADKQAHNSVNSNEINTVESSNKSEVSNTNGVEPNNNDNIAESGKSDSEISKTNLDTVSKISEPQIDTDQKYDDEKIQALIKDFIENNPEVIINSLQRMHEQKVMEAKETSEKKLQDKIEQVRAIANIDHSYLGNKDGDVKIILFFDYNCGYCKQANETLADLIKSDPEVKIVLQHNPILGDKSNYLARIALSVSMKSQDIFTELHNYIMTSKPTEAQIESFLKSKGIKDLKALLDSTSSNVNAEIEDVHQLYNYVGIRGVPAMIIGEKLYAGFLPLDQLQQAVFEARAGNKK